MDEKKPETRGGTEPRRYPPVLRKVDNPDQLPPPLNREQRRALKRKRRS